MHIFGFNNLFRVSPMGMIPGDVLNDDRADPTTVMGRTKKQNLASGVGVGKDRAPHAPRIFLAAALNNHK